MNLYKRISVKSFFKVILIWCVCMLLILHLKGFHKYDNNFNNYIIYIKQNHKLGNDIVAKDVETSKQKFLVDSENCKILDVNPFDNTIKHLLDLHPQIVVCDEEKDFTYMDNHTVFINKTRKPKGLTYCRAKPILNWPQKSFIFGKESHNFESSIPITDEFIKIECFNSSGSTIAENFHMQFVHKNNGREKIPNISKSPNPDELNVLLIMHDSTSRINSLRYMPKTRRYLSETLGAVEMMGYNKVADNTRVNMVPLLTGEFVDNQACLQDKQGLDNCSFIWKNFSRKGYVTHFGEDWPSFGIFHWNMPGFKHQPTDYFDYPFHKAHEGDGTKEFDGCFQGKLWSEILYNRMIDLATNLGPKPHFLFTLQKRHTHDYRTGLADIDDSTKNALSKLYENNLLNNTFLALFGDHGSRWGAVRQTFIGRLEERLPLMFIYVPVWFRRKYHKYFRNLNMNSKRLTTHFDMHSTLLHLLDLDEEIPKDNSRKGISLFNEIPQNRSCHDAGILPHWCTCNYHLTSEVNSTIAKQIASVVVLHLNNLLKKFNTTCEILELTKIQSCLNMLSRNGKMVEYNIVIVTKPLAAILEATVIYHNQNKTYNVAGDISRLNKYKGQSDCMKDYKLRKFCVCKKKSMYT